ncbi:MAG: chromate efflux transporter [Kiloniellales bacterium]|nr:chromate efflux transporter [Kiloniellales bacterium]
MSAARLGGRRAEEVLMGGTDSMAGTKSEVPKVDFREAFRVWLRIGLISFGGPAGQIALMHKVLVEEKKWIDEARFLHALNFCMLLPGPEAQQLATYVGWLLHRTLGGLIAGILFVLPGALVILALSLLYAAFGQLPLVEAAFFGIKAVVLAVVAEALLRIGRRALRSRLHLGIAAAAFVGIFFFALPFPLIVVLAGLLGFLGAALGQRADPKEPDAEVPIGRADRRASLRAALVCLALWLAPTAALLALLGPDQVFSQIAVFFSKMAVVTFGGAYAVLAYVGQQAVETYAWLEPGEMLDGLGLAETTPGPLIMVVQFVGFLGAHRNPGALDPFGAGILGAVLTTWVTFLPCFAWIFLGAPYVEALRGNRKLDAALSGVTAAVVGVILNLALWFALHISFARVEEVRISALRLYRPVWESVDPASLVLTAAALVAMLRFKLPMLPTLAAGAALGALYHVSLS